LRRFDVVIIGGGPAGAALAARLALAGRPVAVLDKSVFPRPKVCGEFIAAPGVRALQELGVALPPGEELGRVALWAGGLRIEAPLMPSRAIAREVLDPLILDRAVRAGAALYQPARALGLTRTRGGFRVHASHGVEMHARAVVAAHGSWDPGPLPTQCTRTPPAESDLFGFKAHFRRHRVPARTIGLVPFAGGYAGVLELGNGAATFACSVRRAALRALRRSRMSAGEALFRHVLASSTALEDALGDGIHEGPWLAVGPLRPGIRPLVRDGIFAVGNAAGEVHPIVGEGITLALESASALAAPLIDALARGCDPLEAAAPYRSRYRAALRRRLWRSAALATIAMNPALAACAREPLRRMPSLLAFAARA
jgi:menaquinone-9 beta-reductase